jgi:GMP synthase (glutamine-hydrolysing)
MKILIIDVLCVPSGERQFDLMVEVLPWLKEKQIEVKTIHPDRESLDYDLIDWADKIILSGSFKSVYDDFHWKVDLEKAVKKIIADNKPMQAICFGAQFTAWCLGAKVARNPEGIEFGTVEVVLTDDGKNHQLLGKRVHDGNKLKVHSSHKDAILELPNGAKLLAYNQNTPVQAFEYGNILATQFHPDYPHWFMEKLLEMRKDFFRETGFLRDDMHLNELRNGLKHGESGWSILAGFLDKQ